MKNKFFIIGGIALAVLGILVLWDWNKWRIPGATNLIDQIHKSDPINLGNTGVGGSISSNCLQAGPPICSKLLEEGVSGIEVCRLQKYLNSTLPYSIVVDGIFGPNTRQALLDATQTTFIRLQDLPGMCGNS